MKLLIEDAGDRSVGINPCYWTVECPFIKEDADKETLDWFREEQLKLYKEFAEGKLTANYILP